MNTNSQEGIIAILKNKNAREVMARGIAASFLGMLVMACSGCGGGGGDAPAPAQPSQPTAAPPLPVYLVLGQSNAVGRTNVADLATEWTQPQADALIFNGSTWANLAPGVVQADGFGPELSFGKSMSSHGRLGIIKSAVGSTSLAVDWSPSRAGSLYSKTLAAVQTAKVTRSIKIAGVLWMQGESDAMDADAAKAYGANLTAFIQALRMELGDQSIPFAACRVNPIDQQMPYVAEVRAGQEGISLAGYAWINCDGLAKQVDGVHYNASGEIDLGNLFADAMVRLGSIK